MGPDIRRGERGNCKGGADYLGGKNEEGRG
jgi:hypothetical protein